MDVRLKRLFVYYVLAVVCVALILSAIIITGKYAAVLSDTLAKYETIKNNALLMKRADKDIQAQITQVQSMLPGVFTPELAEGAIVTTLDKMAARLKDADVLVGAFNKKESEVSLPVTLSGMMGDYRAFLNYIGYLQSLNAPFFTIENLSLGAKVGEKQAGVHYEIRGFLKVKTYAVGEKT
ncbi:MAG: hypothetical protein JW950_05860 [Deltaproteobacteria bacterium]|nr:hypothetical protein [Deltaproteobacteria bacterium]